MTVERPRDNLLTFTRLALTILIGLIALLGIGAMIGLVALFVVKDRLMPQLIEAGFHEGSLPWIALLLVIAATMAACGVQFFRLLRRIVDSVAQGDPFVPINADRLQSMAWLSLGIQGLIFAATPLVLWFEAMREKTGVERGDNGLSVSSIVMALLLFVLARVFRVGSQMREDLEGTV